MPKTNNGGRGDASRRRLLKSVAGGGTALGLVALPGQWAKPVVASVILPAHAQTSPPAPSGCTGTITNCPSGYLITDSDSEPETVAITVSQATKYGNISYNGSLEGSYGTQDTIAEGPCPAPCDDANGQKYFAYSISFGNLTASYGVTLGIRCGDEPVARKYYNFSGTFTGAAGGVRTYAGLSTLGYEACKYLFNQDGPQPEILQQAPRQRRRGLFQFGR